MVTDPTSMYEDLGSIPGLAQWLRIQREALIQPLAWELSYAAGAALKSHNNNNKNEVKSCMFSYLLYIYRNTDARRGGGGRHRGGKLVHSLKLLIQP